MMIKSLLLSCAAVTATGCSALTGGVNLQIVHLLMCVR